MKSAAPFAHWSALPLRLIVGFGFLMHGYLKLERGIDFFAAALDGIGIPFPQLMAWITTLIELMGGAAILLGAYVALVSVPMTIVLLVAGGAGPLAVDGWRASRAARAVKAEGQAEAT